ncbi:class I SAM-dependent methyltransferase [bacterium]|nr:class I SAM-dependent methyltransferase [bacterium]
MSLKSLFKYTLLFKIKALVLVLAFVIDMGFPLAAMANTLRFEKEISINNLSPKLMINATLLKQILFSDKYPFLSKDNEQMLSQKIGELIDRLQSIKLHVLLEDEKQIRAELAYYITKAYEITRITYDKLSEHYTSLRDKEPKGDDLKVLVELVDRIRKIFPEEKNSKITILDEGTGFRDLNWLSTQNGIVTVGIDNSQGVVESIRKNQKDTPLLICQMDMTAMGFPDELFEVVRSQAALHHLVLVDKWQGADLAVQEAYRVLKPKGIYYICLKAETDERNGFSGLDTKEGLGERFYQFYSKESLKALLERNGFVLLGDIKERVMRGTEKELIVYAQKLEQKAYFSITDGIVDRWGKKASFSQEEITVEQAI